MFKKGLVHVQNYSRHRSLGFPDRLSPDFHQGSLINLPARARNCFSFREIRLLDSELIEFHRFPFFSSLVMPSIFLSGLRAKFLAEYISRSHSMICITPYIIFAPVSR